MTTDFPMIAGAFCLGLLAGMAIVITLAIFMRSSQISEEERRRRDDN